jgi:bifunctional UDP-N-acetylglucosamine pyrophosphorylase/glucosamine-1-phosphate N-acetyltransferase
VREVNAGFLAASKAHLDGWLSKVQNRNVQGEYYLTDVIALAVRDAVR